MDLETRRERRKRLRELAGLFLWLGSFSFGGPTAHIALMEEEVVRKRGWVTRGEFLDMLGAANLVPGPNSTELAIHIGHRRAGGWGLAVAGLCFILPAVLIVTAIAWSYTRWGGLPEAHHVLTGIKPVMIAIVFQALWRLAPQAAPTGRMGLLCVICTTLALLGWGELALLGGAGLVATAMVWLPLPRVRDGDHAAYWTPTAVAATSASAAGSATTGAIVAAGSGLVGFSLGSLFLFFLKVGSVLYGSGYVLLAFLRSDLVDRWHWLTEAQLLDAIAVGQFTPGPVFTTATFIGYVLGGCPGAALATLGIFLPAFVFVAISGPLVPWLRRSRPAAAFLDGVNAASLALMAAVTIQLSKAAVQDGFTACTGLVALLILMRWRVNSAWLVAGGAALGWARGFVAG